MKRTFQLLAIILFTVSQTVSATTFSVLNLNSDGIGSLFQAISDARVDASATILNPHVIDFSALGVGAHIITPLAQLEIDQPMHVDGSTIPSGSSLTIRANGQGLNIFGNGSGSHVNDIIFESTNNGNGINVGNGITDIKIGPGVIIDGFANNGINIANSCNRITIGDAAGSPNIIHGCQSNGVYMDGASIIRIVNTWLGIQPDGLTMSRNMSHGIYSIGCSNIVVGGPNPTDRNTVSGSGQHGIYFFNGSSDILIEGNYVGTDPTGEFAIPNDENGVSIDLNTQDVLIKNNVISGNGVNVAGVGGAGIPGFDGIYSGIGLQSQSSDITIVGNIIGLDKDGVDVIDNSNYGIWSGFDCSNIVIGGLDDSDRNIISGNGQSVPQNVFDTYGYELGSGIVMGTVNGLEIINNYIGTDISGTIDLGNAFNGITLNESSEIVIGGSRQGQNVIAGNEKAGVSINESTGSIKLSHNLIGLDMTGVMTMGNDWHGMTLSDQSGVVIESNFIAGSGGVGIVLINSSTNTITNNYVGLDSNKTGAINTTSNDLGGLRIAAVGGSASNNVVQGNVFAYSSTNNVNDTIGNSYGIFVGGASADENLLTQNLIWCNDELAINLNLSGNTFGTSGAGNNGHQQPEISISNSSGSLVVGTAFSGDQIEVFQKSECGCDAKNYLGSVTAGVDGSWMFETDSLTFGKVSVTGTDASNNTSQLSCVKVKEGIIDPISAICFGDSISISIADHEAVDLIWQFSLSTDFSSILFADTVSVFNALPVIYDYLPMASGSIFVRVLSYLNDNEMAISNIEEIRLNELPSYSSISANPQSICPGESATVSLSNPSSGSTVTWYTSSDSLLWDEKSPFPGNTFVDEYTQKTYFFATLSANLCTINTDTIVIDMFPEIIGSASLHLDTNNVCENSVMTFTSQVDVGGDLSYQWFVNGIATTTDYPFVSSVLEDGDTVSLQVTTDTTCIVSNAIASDSIVAGIIEIVDLDVNALAIGGSEVCNGDTLKFSSQIVNGGNLPVYSWFVNGVLVGSDSTFTSIELIDGDQVYLSVVSSQQCVSESKVDSDSIQITSGVNIIPEISISGTSGVLCLGSEMEFNAIITGGGASPQVYWYHNDLLIDSLVQTIIIDNAQDGDSVWTSLVSSASCVVKSGDSSNVILLEINPVEIPEVVIEGPTGTVCTKDQPMFTVTTNGVGSTPQVIWYVNGIAVDTSLNSFTYSDFSDKDSISAVVISSALCASQISDTSEAYMLTVTELSYPSISLSSVPRIICLTDTVSLEATVTDGGTSPIIHWYINDSIVDSNSTVLAITDFTDEDRIWVTMVSSVECAKPFSDTSEVQVLSVTETTFQEVTLTVESDTLCEGETFNFEAISASSSSQSTYLWMINDVIVDTSSLGFFNSNELVDGDKVGVMLHTFIYCAIPDPVRAVQDIVVSVNENSTANFDLGFESKGDCIGDSLSFSVGDTSGLGSNPFWTVMLNNTPILTNQVNWGSDTLRDGDEVTFQVESSALCADQRIVSQTYRVSLDEVLESALSMTMSSNFACLSTNQSITFIATDNLSHSSENKLRYQWSINGDVVSDVDSAILELSAPQNFDSVTVRLVTNQSCVSEDTLYANTIIRLSHPVTAVTEGQLAFINEGIYPLDGTGSTEANDINYSWIEFTNDDSTKVGNTVIADFKAFESQHDFLLIVNNEFCVDTAHLTISIDYQLHIPNVFSPNGDANHDVWMITNIEKFPGAEVQIFNRWGSVVYQSVPGECYKLENAWDGKLGGNKVPDATYYYILDLNDGSESIAGDVTILR